MKQMESDVVVISAGTAGLATTVTAADGGASVIVFEKADRTGGTPGGGQIIAVESGPQRRKGITLTSKELFKIHMDYVHWCADARLIKAFYDESGKTIDWYESMGLEFNVMDGPGKYPVTHRAAGSPNSRVELLTNKANELGVQILCKTPVKKILKEGDRVVGVTAEDESGEEIRASAKAVIVATGGFGDNPDMIKKYTGFEWGKDIFSFRMSGMTGDGIRMAWEVGAAQSEMIMQLIFGLPHPYMGATGTTPDFVSFVQPNLMVNLLGERFIDEESLADTTFGGNNIARQKGRCAFMIFDEDIKKHYVEERLDIPFPGPPGISSEKADKLDAALKKAQEQQYEHLFIADSIEDLCAQTGIDLTGLQNTIAEYNKCCENGYDDVFQKDPKYMRPIKTPKFYAGRFFPSAYGTLGGIKINYKTEVLDNEDKVIPGLYAAGVDASAIYGDSYTRCLYGNTLGFANNSGRIAGKRALEYVKTVSK